MANIIGTKGNDTLLGSNNTDTIKGLAGNDTITGNEGNDTITGNEGNDTITSNEGNDTLTGGTGKNSLVGGIGEDTLNVDFSTGDNTLNGGAGNDNLSARATSGSNLLFGGDGNDYLNASYLTTNYVDNYDDFIASKGNNTLNGGAGDDRLFAVYSSGNNLLSGDDGNDSLSVSGYQDKSFDFTSEGNNTLNGGVGDDRLFAVYSSGNNLLSGGDGNDYLSISSYSGSTGNNTLNGGAGDDTLRAESSSGNKLLSGGDGNDSFYLSPRDTAPSDLVTQTVDGGKGDDVLYINYVGATGRLTTTFNATTNIGSITGGTYQVSYKNIERLNITGTYNDDLIVGNSGNDTLSGGYGGNDTIDGGKGDDLLSADYSNVTKRKGITTTFNATTNIGSITAGTNGVSYKNIERLDITGTEYDDLIVGSNGNDTLSRGNGGNDTIDGGKGDDVLFAGYFSVTSGGITSTFNATTNIGSIRANGDQVSYKNIERLNIRDTNNDDLIVGSNGNDTLSGGRGGNDTIDGGKGEDWLSVGFYSLTKGITSTFNASTTIGSITAGTDLVSYKNIERLNIFGTSYDDLIVGSNGNDTLSGGQGGNDSLIGGAGTDTFAFNSFDEGADYLDDFNATNELIQVSADRFYGALSPGTLFASQFTIGASATTTEERFIYDFSTGGLFFDQDGSASEFTQVQFAQLSTGLSLTENNFVVV